MLKQGVIEAMAGKRLAITDNYQFHTGTGDCHIHAPQIPKKTDITLVVVTHHANDNDITLLPLKAVDRVHAHLSTQTTIKPLKL